MAQSCVSMIQVNAKQCMMHTARKLVLRRKYMQMPTWQCIMILLLSVLRYMTINRTVEKHQTLHSRAEMLQAGDKAGGGGGEGGTFGRL